MQNVAGTNVRKIYMQIQSPVLLRQEAEAKARRERLSGKKQRVDSRKKRVMPAEKCRYLEDNECDWKAEIIALVCRHYGLEFSAVIGSSRMDHLTKARFVIMYLVDVLTVDSLGQIARALNKDKSLVKYGIKRIEGLIQDDCAFAEEIEALRLELIGVPPHAKP